MDRADGWSPPYQVIRPAIVIGSAREERVPTAFSAFTPSEIGHLVRPAVLASLIPPKLGDPTPWTPGSDVAELPWTSSAAALLHRTQPIGRACRRRSS